MPVFLRSALVAALASLCVAGAYAQSDTDASASANAIIDAGLGALHQVDAGNADELWNNSAAFIRTAMNKQDYVDGIRQARLTVGSVARRDWANVTRIRFVEGSTRPPPGMYANIDYATHLTDGRTVFEKVSLRLDPDGWRLTGYVPRQQQ
jgi:Protein of unknown function (DUF4019)